MCGGAGGNDFQLLLAPFLLVDQRVRMVEMLYKLFMGLTGYLITANIRAVSVTGIHVQLAYLLFGITNIVIIG